MTWGEAVRLTRTLRGDPSSSIAAAIEDGWDHPISREALVLMDLFDLEHRVNSKKPPAPHPGRPGKPPVDRRRTGNAGDRSPAEVMSILAAAREGHPPV